MHDEGPLLELLKSACPVVLCRRYCVYYVLCSDRTFLFQVRLTNLYAGLLDHNREKTQQTDLMVDRIRAWQVALLEDLVSLIELREEKLRKEVAEEILGKFNFPMYDCFY